MILTVNGDDVMLLKMSTGVDCDNDDECDEYDEHGEGKCWWSLMMVNSPLVMRGKMIVRELVMTMMILKVSISDDL